MEGDIPIDPPDALWLSALVRDRARAEQRLRDVLPGRDVQAAAEVAARCVHAELDRETRLAERRRPRWIDLQVAALRAERKARPMLPAWAEWCRRARVSVGKGPGGMAGVTAWDGAARRAVALRLPQRAWGQSGGEPEAGPHRLGIDGYDAARWLPVGVPMQLYAPEWREEDTEVPPDGVGVVERG